MADYGLGLKILAIDEKEQVIRGTAMFSNAVAHAGEEVMVMFRDAPGAKKGQGWDQALANLNKGMAKPLTLPGLVWGFNAAGLYQEKVATHYGLSTDREFPIACKDGYAVESFGQGLNLMLAIPVRLRDTWQEVLDEINSAESCRDAKPNSQEWLGSKNSR